MTATNEADCNHSVAVAGHTWACRMKGPHDKHRAPVDRDTWVEEYTIERGAEIVWPNDVSNGGPT